MDGRVRVRAASLHARDESMRDLSSAADGTFRARYSSPSAAAAVVNGNGLERAPSRARVCVSARVEARAADDVDGLTPGIRRRS